MVLSNNSAAPVRIGEWILLPHLNLLRRADDDEVHLEPRHADLLRYLATHRGQVLSAEDIIDQVWERQIVTDQSVYQAIAKLRKALGDSAADSRYIETVTKRGYRLIAEVSWVDSGTDPSMGRPRPDAAANRLRLRRWLGVGVFATALAVIAWALLQPQQGAAPDGQGTVAVLPFTMLSDDPEDRFIAKGFSIELAHALGRSGQIRVIGPTSSQLATRLGSDLPDIARHVGAEFVVSGSIQRAKNGIRVIGALTEVPSGYQVWSEVFDRSNRDILATQREVANAIAAALLHKVEGGAEPGPAHLQPFDAPTYDSYLLARYYRNRRTQFDLERAEQYFNQVLDLDTDFFPAVREMAATQLLLSFYGDLPLSQAVENAESHLTHAVELSPEDPELLAMIGLSHYMQGAYGLAEDFLLRAVAIHSNLAEAWMWLGLVRQQQGRLRDALPAFEHASQLEPLLVTSVVNYANALNWSGQGQAALEILTNLAARANAQFDNRDQLFRVMSGILLDAGQLEQAYMWAKRALDISPDSALSEANEVLILAFLGQIDAASEIAKHLYSHSTPGRGANAYLLRANVESPGVLDTGTLSAHLDELQRQPDTPEIEWRLANVDVGMAAYFNDELEQAIAQLGKALQGRNYPVTRADGDVFICASLVDALQRDDRKKSRGRSACALHGEHGRRRAKWLGQPVVGDQQNPIGGAQRRLFDSAKSFAGIVR